MAQSLDDDSNPLLDTLPSERPRKAKLADNTILKSCIWTGFIVALNLFAGTLIWKELLTHDEEATFSDAFYFAAVTFTTIGYGDVTPSTTTGKVFFMIYVGVSLIVQLTVVSTFVSDTVQLASTQKEAHSPPSSALFKVRPRLVAAMNGVIVLCGLLFLGAALLHYLEGHAWFDCFYWALTTLSTVGYGDIVPETHRALFAVFFLVSVVTFTFVLGEVVSIVVEVRRLGRLSAFFKHGFTLEMLHRMDDVEANAEVSKVEFMMFMLAEMDLVDRDQLENILEMFDELDFNGDGVLDIQDIHSQILRSSDSGIARSARLSAG